MEGTEKNQNAVGKLHPIVFKDDEYDVTSMTGKVKTHLMGHPNSQMIYDLQQEIKETLSNRLPDTTGMAVVESPAGALASFNPARHFSRVLVSSDCCPCSSSSHFIGFKMQFGLFA